MIRLGDSTWATLAGPGVAPPIVAIPIGSCEQHGPHLPLDTDTRIAVAIAEGLAAADTRVAVAPPLTITASGEHQGFPGTLSIGNDVLEMLVVELVRSADWSAGVILVNGHGGNVAAVRRAVTALAAEGRDALCWWPHLPGGDAHAGRTETSLMLAISPQLVRIEHAAAGNVTPLAELLPALYTGGVAAVSANGVLGDPRGASADEGGALLDELVTDALAAVRRWRPT